MKRRIELYLSFLSILTLSPCTFGYLTDKALNPINNPNANTIPTPAITMVPMFPINPDSENPS